MGILDKLLGRGGSSAQPREIGLDRAVRRSQMMQLEGALLDLADAISDSSAARNPGWAAIALEYSRTARGLKVLRAREFSRSEMIDLSFEVRPVFKGDPAEGMEQIGRLQDRAMMIARKINEPLPQELDPTE